MFSPDRFLQQVWFNPIFVLLYVVFAGMLIAGGYTLWKDWQAAKKNKQEE